MSDYVFGDKFTGGKFQQFGDHSTVTVTNSGGVSQAELDAAVAELRSFVAQLTREGVVDSDGSVADPSAVLTAVKSQPGRLKALGTAIAGGAKDAILSMVQGGVAALIVALVGRT